MTYHVLQVDEKIGKTSGKPYWVLSLKDEQGVSYDGVSTFDKINQGDMINGEVVTNEKGYKNFKSAQKTASSNFVNKQKQEGMKEIIDYKTNSIHAAQDRSAWMWAKNNAALLIANNDKMKNYDIDDMMNLINEMATTIYNQEPLRPF